MLSGNFSINAQTNWNDAQHFLVWFWNVITLVSLQHLVFFLWVRFEFFIRLLRELCRLWRKLIQLILLLRFDKFFHYIMNSCCFVISYCLLHFLRSKEKSWIVTLSSLWMGHAMYFSLETAVLGGYFCGLCGARGFRTLYYGPSHICSHLLRSMSVADGWNLANCLLYETPGMKQGM